MGERGGVYPRPLIEARRGRSGKKGDRLVFHLLLSPKTSLSPFLCLVPLNNITSLFVASKSFHGLLRPHPR
jgi:hypothetical protein